MAAATWACVPRAPRVRAPINEEPHAPAHALARPAAPQPRRARAAGHHGRRSSLMVRRRQPCCRFPPEVSTSPSLPRSLPTPAPATRSPGRLSTPTPPAGGLPVSRRLKEEETQTSLHLGPCPFW
jgi:hypothetical protein